jgi:hypothetical protein
MAAKKNKASRGLAERKAHMMENEPGEGRRHERRESRKQERAESKKGYVERD